MFGQGLGVFSIERNDVGFDGLSDRCLVRRSLGLRRRFWLLRDQRGARKNSDKCEYHADFAHGNLFLGKCRHAIRSYISDQRV